MDKEDVERLRKEFPGQQEVSDAVPLVWLPANLKIATN
jgi:hypothetical protein